MTIIELKNKKGQRGASGHFIDFPLSILFTNGTPKEASATQTNNHTNT
jgi:hypothetical protein